MHFVIGKIYADWCGYCQMMNPAWKEMVASIEEEMKPVVVEKSPLKYHKKYVSKDGNKVVEVIEIESESMDDELPYIQKEYSPEIEMQGGFPTLFKIANRKVSYYGGERTAEKMKQWYFSNKKTTSGGTRRKRKHRKTKKNKTRGRYTRTTR